MAETALRRAGALAGIVPARLPGCDLTIEEAPPLARFILRGENVVDQAANAFGAVLPGPLSSASAGHRQALWLGPDEWLLLTDEPDGAAMAASLTQALAGTPHALVDVSHRQTGIVLAGGLAELALAAGCPLDVHRVAFPVGRVSRTIFAKAEIVLWRRDAMLFHLEVWRSFAPYLVSLLTHIRAELAAEMRVD
jgi:sarcosine oxidase subunit gamma